MHRDNANRYNMYIATRSHSDVAGIQMPGIEETGILEHMAGWHTRVARRAEGTTSRPAKKP